ncbi:hypothetical protein ACFYUJ_21195 [Streptomyces sp. NPDC004520]|uniref:hypothetical protein n=1 Tax=Streptomyces sp. NPDC004520 TaxID=3364702 RepID=UPI0036A08B4B
MPAFPAFDPTGVAYDLHLWHPDYGSVHIWVGTPGRPDISSPGVDAVIKQLAEDLVPQIGGEKVIEIVRIKTDGETLPGTPTTP